MNVISNKTSRALLQHNYVKLVDKSDVGNKKA